MCVCVCGGGGGGGGGGVEGAGGWKGEGRGEGNAHLASSDKCLMFNTHLLESQRLVGYVQPLHQSSQEARPTHSTSLT